MEVSERLHYIRKHLNLTQDQFAAKIALKRGVVSLWESGTRMINERGISNLKTYLNVNPRYVLEGLDPIFLEEDGERNVKDDPLPDRNTLIPKLAKYDDMFSNTLNKLLSIIDRQIEINNKNEETNRINAEANRLNAETNKQYAENLTELIRRMPSLKDKIEEDGGHKTKKAV